nr:putative reverse transcriptase domain-containing protein [Tanacetum cinerariifolium]
MDHKSLQHIFDQKKLNTRQRRWIELFSYYDCEIRYHPGKTNVVANALNIKERVKPKRVRAMSMTIQSSMKEKLLATQNEATKEHNAPTEILRGLDKQMEKKGDGDYSMEKLSRLYIKEVVARHEVHVLNISDRDVQFTSRFWITLQKALGIRLDLSTPYNPPTDRQSERTIQTLEDMLRACVIDFGGSWDTHLHCAEVGETRLIGPELVQETIDKVVLIKERLKAARDRQKRYADRRQKPLEFEEGDHVLLKVSHWKGAVCFGKKGKLAPRYVGPFEVLERIGPVAYRLRLPQELSNVHDIFHVSNLKKCLADASLQVPLEEIHIDKTLLFVEETVEIMDREIKKLKRSMILIVKVRWNSKHGPESRFWITLQKALGMRLDLSTPYNPQTDRQSERTIQTLEDMLRACVIDFGGSWDTHLPCAEVGETRLIGPELVQETTDKVVLIKERLKAARDRQKRYADRRQKPLEFEEGDHVLLKVSPWKGAVCFGKKGKLAPRYVGPFEVLERIGPVAYRLRLPQELSNVHDIFHVSNLKKCLADASL